MEVQVVEIKEADGKTSYLIVGSRQQCVAQVVNLESKGEGHWYQIGYYSRDPRNPKNDLHVWKFFYGKVTAMAVIKQQALGGGNIAQFQ